MKSFKELAQARYSLKAFSGKPVEEDKLQQILETGNIAPTAKDAQSHRIYVLQSPEALEKANAATPCIYGAATVLLFTFNKGEAFTYPGQGRTQFRRGGRFHRSDPYHAAGQRAGCRFLLGQLL